MIEVETNEAVLVSQHQADAVKAPRLRLTIEIALIGKSKLVQVFGSVELARLPVRGLSGHFVHFSASSSQVYRQQTH